MSDEAAFSQGNWQDHNRRGLGFAAASDWEEAAKAFSVASELLAHAKPGEAPRHEAMALVLGNLANACFRTGRIDEALNHGQRACALRVALAGEDGMPGARARMDLAVMLATAGRSNEALALVQRAIRTVEHHVGEDDPNFGVVLENAARIALSSGAVESAEPILLRLHALLELHNESTRTADSLLQRITQIREAKSARTTSGSQKAVKTNQVAHGSYDRSLLISSDTPDADSVESSFLKGNWEDQPLREAVVLTDVLLRSTPAGVAAIPAIADTEIAVADPESGSEADSQESSEADAANEAVCHPEPAVDDVPVPELIEQATAETELIADAEPLNEPATGETTAHDGVFVQESEESSLQFTTAASAEHPAIEIQTADSRPPRRLSVRVIIAATTIAIATIAVAVWWLLQKR